MYMYLSLPKDSYDVGTLVAPEEKNIVDMPAMNFCFQFEGFSWMVLCTPMYFVKAASERNANSNHQVCYNFNHRENKPGLYISYDLM